MDKDDKKQDKAMKQHDAQEHKGGKGTKLSLRKGGVTSESMKSIGRNLARAANQKSG